MRRVTLLPEIHVVAGPTLEPLDLEVVKQAMNNQTDADDALLDVWISAARQRFEAATGVQVMHATIDNHLEAFPCRDWAIELQPAPVASVLSLTYLDPSGVLQTLDPTLYTVAPIRTAARPQRGLVTPLVGTYWPQAACRPGAVRVQFVAGYGSAIADVPELVRAILLDLVRVSYCATRCEGDKAPPRPMSGFDQLLTLFTTVSVQPMEAWVY